jgi:hypothetical protein
MNTNSTRLVGVPFLLAVVIFSGCIPQPIAHKKVKRPPPNPDVVSTRLGFTSTTAPGLLRDDQVKPVTLIVPSFEERSEQEVAAEALSQIGPSALPELRRALQSRDPRIRREAAGVLVRMGPEGKDAVPDLIRLLDDEDEPIRKLAARALGRIGPEAAAAVPALMRTLLEPQATPSRK